MEYLNMPVMHEKYGWDITQKEKMILRCIDKYRRVFDKDAMIAVSNFLQVIRIARKNDISGLDLSYLDLRRITFSHMKCSRKNMQGAIAAKFDGSIIDQWSFRTVGFCGDLSGLCIISSLNAIVFSDKNLIYIMERDTKEIMKSICVEGDSVQSISVSLDEKHLLISSINGGIYEWNMLTDDIVQLVKCQEGELLGEAQYLTMDDILFATREKKIFLYKKGEMSLRKFLDVNVNTYMIADDKIFVASRGREVFEYDIYSLKLCSLYSNAHTTGKFIMNLHLTEDKKRVIGCAKNGVVIEWVREEKEPDIVYNVPGDINKCALSKSENVIYCLSEQKGLFKIDRYSQKVMLLAELPKARWINMILDEEKQQIILSSIEGMVTVFDMEKRTFEIAFEKSHEYEIPYLSLEGCSFCKMNEKSSIDDVLIETLKKQNVKSDLF